MCRSKNAGVAGYAEAFRPVQSDSQTSEWHSYFEYDPVQICLDRYAKKEICNLEQKTAAGKTSVAIFVYIILFRIAGVQST